MGAVGVPGRAAAAAVEDKPVAEVGPGGAWEEFYQILFDADGILKFREAEALGEAADMGIHHDAFIFRKSVAEDDIRGLAADAG